MVLGAAEEREREGIKLRVDTEHVSSSSQLCAAFAHLSFTFVCVIKLL
jgi:hypothetical protein